MKQFLEIMRACTVIASSVVLAVPGHAQAQDQKVEEELHVHRLATETTAPYDAFAYANRVQTAPAEGQSAFDYAGNVIFSRLSNVEGRIQLKVLEGFDRSAYLGYKAFLRAWPEEGAGVGNCVVCHTPPNFTDNARHVVDESGTTKETLPLRNLKDSGTDVEAIIRQKMELAEKARTGDAPNVDEAYKLIRLSDSDVANLVSFIKSLNEVPEDHFRDLIVNAEILDTSNLIN